MKIKFAVAFLLLAVVLTARAIIPPPVLAIAGWAGEGLSIGMNALMQATVTAAAIKYLTVQDQQTGQSIRVPISDNPPEPNAPSTAVPTSPDAYKAGSSSYGATSQDACQVAYQGTFCANPPSYITGCGCQSTSPTVCSCQYYLNGTLQYHSVQVSANPSPSYDCPNGYGYASNQCTLSDSRAAQPDSAIDYMRQGGAYVPASTSDADAPARSVPVSSNSNGGLSFSGYTDFGEKTSTTVTPLPSGGTLIDTYINRSTGVVELQRLTFDADGHVIGFQVTETAGSLEYDEGTETTVLQGPQYMPNPDGSVSTLPQNPGGSSSLNIQFPNDYARENTLADLRDKTGQIKDKLANSEDISDPVLPDGAAFDDAFFKDTFADLLSWELPLHSSECPTPSFSWNNSTYVISSHCGLINDHWGLLQTAMAVVWTIAGLYVVLRS